MDSLKEYDSSTARNTYLTVRDSAKVLDTIDVKRTQANGRLQSHLLRVSRFPSAAYANN